MSSIGTNASNITPSQEIIPDSLNPNQIPDPIGVAKDGMSNTIYLRLYINISTKYYDSIIEMRSPI